MDIVHAYGEERSPRPPGTPKKTVCTGTRETV